MVECVIWDHDAVGSSPASPTIKNNIFKDIKMDFDFSIRVPFIQYQLIKYYEINYYTIDIATICHCSSSTVRKYKDQFFNIPKELLSILETIPRSDRQIIVPWEDRFQYVAEINGRPKINDKKPIEIKSTTKEIINYLPPINIQLKPKNIEKIPTCGGLYLLGQIVCLLQRPEERYCLIKIGMSTNLQNRVKSYKGMNPFAVCIDYITLPLLNANEIK